MKNNKSIYYYTFLFMLSSLCLPVVVICNDFSEDAVIIQNSIRYDYDLVSKNNIYYFERTTTVKRRIKILSQYGIENFNALFIPTYNDIDFNRKLLYIKATTIKDNGEKIPANTKNIKETTLPANIPFFYGYKGKVKKLPFENVQVNDEIEYEYQIKFTSSSGNDYLNFTDKKIISEEFPVKNADYQFRVSPNLNFQGIPNNLSAQFSEKTMPDGDKVYSIKLQDITPLKKERYSRAFEYPQFYYNIHRNKYNFQFSSWEEYVENADITTKKKSFLSSGLTIKNIASKVKDIEKVLPRVEKIKRILFEDYLKDIEKLLYHLNYFEPDFYDAKQIIKLFNMLDINASIVMVKDKEKGKIIKELITFEQFDECLVEFFDENGEKYYLSLFSPFCGINEIPSQYRGTEALRISNEGKSKTFDFIQLPGMDSHENIQNTNYAVTLHKKTDSILVSVKKNVSGKGAYYHDIKDIIELEKLDTLLSLFSDATASQIESYFDKVEVDTVLIHDTESELNYSVNYRYSIPKLSSGSYSIPLSEIIRESIFTDIQTSGTRKTNAYFNYPKTNDYTVNITLDGNYKFEKNNLLEGNINTEHAEFNSEHNLIASNRLELKFKYTLFTDYCQSNSWKNIERVHHEIYKFLKQRLVVIE